MPYLIFDLEMSGGEVGFNEIIQIGAVLADDNWKIISEFESLVYPENEEAYTKGAEEVHGISIDDLEDAPMAFDVLESFELWIRKSLKKRSDQDLTDIIVCGQSVINDVNFLQQKHNELNLKWPFSFKLIDLMSLSFMFYQIFDHNKIPRPKSYSLKAVSEYFKLERENDTHNALEDAKLTYFCFKKYMELMVEIKL